MIKRLLPFLMPFWQQRWLMLLGLLLGLLTVIAAVGLLALSGWLISASAVAGVSLATAMAFNYYIPGGGVRAFSLLRILGRYGERVISHDSTLRILTGLRVWFYRRLEPLSALTQRRHGVHSADLLNRIVTDVDVLNDAYLRVLTPFFIAVISSLLLFILLAIFNFEIAAIVLISMIAAGFIVPVLAAKLGAKAGKLQVGLIAKLRVHSLDMIQGIAEILNFGIEKRYFARFQAYQSRLLQLQAKLNRLDAWSQVLIQLLLGLALLATLFFGAQQVLAGELSGTSLALMSFAVLAAFEAVMPLPSAFLSFGRTRKAVARLLEVSEQKPQVRFRQHSLKQPQTYDIAFKQVYFHYPADDDQNYFFKLQNLHLHIQPTEKLALIGATGAGKSTVVQLLTRLFDPDRGEICVGGAPLDQFSEADLRRLISVVSQRSHLFNASLRENLSLANPTATEAQMMAALKTAQLDQLVNRLENGLDTWVGEHGTRFSQGQIRRIAIAQAVLADRPILLLDEPTEGLDPVTAQQLMQTLANIMANKTVLLITHDLQLLDHKLIDRIAVLEQGALQEVGTLAELSRAGTYFSRVYGEYMLENGC